jgi:uncharacterized protein (TIGR02246 family)
MAGSTIQRGGAHPSRTAIIGVLLVVPIVLSTAVSGCRLEVEPEDDVNLEPHVAQMLESSAAAWNRGDLEAFLADYQNAPSTTFVGSGEILSGVDEIRGNYASKFGPGAERDSLRFESIQVRTLTPTIGIVTARWVLHQDGRVRAAGPFTLVMRLTRAGWKITHDHSSSDPAPAAN